MNVAVIIATYGDAAWKKLAQERALPSAMRETPAWVQWFHLNDGTLAEARNQAEKQVPQVADWLCFLDADDELGPGYLDAMRRGLMSHLVESPQSMDSRPRLFVPAVSFVGDTGTRTRPEIPNGGGSRPLIDINHAVIGTLVPRRLFLDVGGFRELPALEDWDLWLRCEEAGAKLVPVPDAVYLAHVRPGSRNVDQTLYQTLRDEALARRA